MNVNNADAKTTAYYTVTGLTSGINYTCWVTCNDKARNSNKTENRTLIIYNY